VILALSMTGVIRVSPVTDLDHDHKVKKKIIPKVMNMIDK
jgi:hypothetical protein